MQKQLVMLSLMMVPLISVTATSCSTDRSSNNPIVAVAERLVPSEFTSTGGVQLTIRLKPTQQHPHISQPDREHVRRVIEGQVNRLNVKGADITAIDIDRILVQLPGVKDSQPAARVLGGTAQLELRAQKAGTEGQLSAEPAVLTAARDEQTIFKKAKPTDLPAIAATQATIEKQYTEISKLFDRAAIAGGHIKEAVAQPSSDAAWEIAIEFDNFGSTAFAKLTRDLAGTGRSIGVFIDDVPISTPTVSPAFAATGITGGNAVIQGNFTAETANDLAIQLRSGSLPVAVDIVEIAQFPPKTPIILLPRSN